MDATHCVVSTPHRLTKRLLGLILNVAVAITLTNNLFF
ncbi:hypothetical protein HALO113_30011 [Halomonas sp. 113]|nr:hypothetical protein HALO113_30011 [Halomonas sp. 113]CAD5280608.1 hypothetical protein HALO156_180373 [Halomonas sp. 156]